jgi:hypothetical protein
MNRQSALERVGFRLSPSGFAAQIGWLTQVQSLDNCYSADDRAEIADAKKE